MRWEKNERKKEWKENGIDSNWFQDPDGTPISYLKCKSHGFWQKSMVRPKHKIYTFFFKHRKYSHHVVLANDIECEYTSSRLRAKWKWRRKKIQKILLNKRKSLSAAILIPTSAMCMCTMSSMDSYSHTHTYCERDVRIQTIRIYR